MTDTNLLKFPIGKFILPTDFSIDQIGTWIETIDRLPSNIEEELNLLSNDQLDLSYREGSWTLRQVIHHLADSHMNSYIRFKWSLTEQRPLIKAYDEKAWARLEDARVMDPNISLGILKGLHQRWTYLLKHMTEEDFNRSFIHPESNYEYSLWVATALYAWHSDHHLGHIKIISRN